ncbi:MAG TPA: hypothetical protein PLX08_13155 [Bacteroidales bacterium]|jgi:hypothetical protein|nr:hypothetical protein [Bacteroidales bacterium]
MNKEEINNDDLLRKFMNRGNTETAPEGFTAKTMARIMIEKQSATSRESFLVRNRVPLVSLAVTAALVICAIFIPAGSSSNLGTKVWSYFSDIEVSLPRLNNLWLENSALPQWITYAVPGILILMFFDRALYVFFRKKDNPGH